MYRLQTQITVLSSPIPYHLLIKKTINGTVNLKTLYGLSHYVGDGEGRISGVVAVMDFVVMVAVLVIRIVRMAAATTLGVRVFNPLVTGPHTKHFLAFQCFVIGVEVEWFLVR